MRLNERTKLCGNSVILVPYEEKHVSKYHEWMSRPELRALTASEALSLEEEYEMQKSWRNDDDKLTFIVLCAKSYARNGDEIASMVGDTNLFMHFDEESQQNVGEAEIMIAESEARGKGYGREAMLLMLKYAQTHLKLDKFEAKIDMDNKISLGMFESFQFVEVRRVAVFHEITLERDLTPEWIVWLDEQVELRPESYES
ncbi:N-acetyltransferase 9-like protein [Scaptodrosophila lebanonensis]|uniref:N-acetyltransferase 9-like protein n=1 Tax=Drosophila lebanonensis TaxID=7225 RepID=A0A6J2T1S1_DROLE|nr:N-acetyltransferase 9-like protein [Scaptodrosophila lebanonensis]